MRKINKILLLTFASLFLLSGWAIAVTYTFEDNVEYWAGYGNGTWKDGEDMIGEHPAVGEMVVVVNDNTRVLEEIKVKVIHRYVYDSLFININGADEAWDYFVRYTDATADSNSLLLPGGNLGSGLYSVVSNYSYDFMPAHNVYRELHPIGINEGSLSLVNGSFAPSYDGTWLTYNFSNLGISMDAMFAVGYVPWCANDVTFGSPSPVPEPATMILLGIGLLGVARITRRKRS